MKKFSNLRPFLSLRFFKNSENLKFWDKSGGKKRIKQSEQLKKYADFFFCLMPQFYKSFEVRDHLFPLFFPKDSKNLNSLDIGLWEVGEKDR